MKHRFPTPPVVVDDQVLSAATLNSYVKSASWLLGFSHGRFTGDFASRQIARYETSWGVMWNGWLYHQSALVDYDLWCGNTSAGKTWFISLQVYGDDSAWHSVLDLTGTTNGHHTGTINLAAVPVTPGQIYPWRIVGRTTDATYYSVVYIWQIASRANISGWAAPPTFANGVIPYASDFNGLRASAVALHGFLPEVEPLCQTRAHGGNIQLLWYNLGAASYDYRPNAVLCGVELESAWAPVRWRVLASTGWGPTAGDTDVELYDSGWLAPGPWHMYYQTLAISPTLTPALGDRLRFVIETQHQNPGAVHHTHHARRGFFLRDSNQVPGAGWPAPVLWQHGDTDVSAARLNALSAALTQLHSGNEALWSQVGACAYQAGGTYAGAYRRRWLVYRHADGKTPTIQYGLWWSQSYSLPRDHGKWLCFDLTHLSGILPGGLYYVHDVDGAFESEAVIGG